MKQLISAICLVLISNTSYAAIERLVATTVKNHGIAAPKKTSDLSCNKLINIPLISIS